MKYGLRIVTGEGRVMASASRAKVGVDVIDTSRKIDGSMPRLEMPA